jgi:L-ascorbate metabolism protein UlaG (beta-lactamase superfamily)
MEENIKIYGNLFGTIDLLNESHIDAILMTMDHDHALHYLVESVKAAHQRGSFTIGESEVISKAIRTLSKSE